MIRIVLAAEHFFFRTGVEAALTKSGVEIVASVGDGPSAAAAIERDKPDIAVLDIALPVVDGIDLLEAERERGSSLPIVLLVAQIDDRALMRAMKARVQGMVIRDNAAPRLKDAIEAVASGHRYIEPELMDRAFSLAWDKPQATLLDSLSQRERKIADAAARGKRNREIAETFGMTEGSIKVYLHRVYEKLQVDNRTELAVLMMSQSRS